MATRNGKDGIMLYVTPDLKDDLKRLAKEDGRSMSNFIVWLLNLYVKEHADGASVNTNAADV